MFGIPCTWCQPGVRNPGHLLRELASMVGQGVLALAMQIQGGCAIAAVHMHLLCMDLPEHIQVQTPVHKSFPNSIPQSTCSPTFIDPLNLYVVTLIIHRVLCTSQITSSKANLNP